MLSVSSISTPDDRVSSRSVAWMRQLSFLDVDESPERGSVRRLGMTSILCTWRPFSVLVPMSL
jgi:hypothetical protein